MNVYVFSWMSTEIGFIYYQVGFTARLLYEGGYKIK